ncbi:MAG: pantoate--beta-alanine ligase [Pontibacterium sp.]
MKTIHSITDLQSTLRQARAQGKRISLVPTMGNLHEGHLQLVHQARACSDLVVSSVFVNPLQFGAGEDLDSYPRTLASDQEKLRGAGCDLLFAPTDEEVYPNGRDNQTEVEVPGLSDLYCGASRPGHFRGVATVVCKLFGIVQPDVAIFGEKDYQQLMVIQRMTADLCLPVEIQGAPIVRNSDGLALSSRNGYLSEEQLALAPVLCQTLRDSAKQIKAGRRDYAQLEEEAQRTLEETGFKRDLYRICNAQDLTTATEDSSQLVILAGAHLGAARLIDNIEIDL